MRFTQLFTIFLTFTVVCSAAFREKPKQKYDAEFEINGKLSLKQFYGPPGYGANPKVDQPDKQFVLETPYAWDFIGTTDPASPSEKNISEMQLLIGETLLNKVKRLVGKNVIATAIAFHSISPLQHTKVLLEIKNLNEAKKEGK